MQWAGDIGFAYSSTAKLPDLVGVKSRCFRSTQPPTVLSSLIQTCAHPFAQDLSFELREDCLQVDHGSASKSCQIQSLRQRFETDSEMFEYLQNRKQVGDPPSPAIQQPHQDNVDLATVRSPVLVRPWGWQKTSSDFDLRSVRLEPIFN